jgi:polycomb protein EED
MTNHLPPRNQQLNYNSVVWSQAENGDPLVCVTGDSRIKVLNVQTGKLTAVCSTSLIIPHVLTWHVDANRSWRCIHLYCRLRYGLANILQSVNDLAISPVDPTILASVSIDHSLRIWSLHPSHQQQPLGAICYGQGHKDQVLTLVCGLSTYPPQHTDTRRHTTQKVDTS